MTMSAGQSRKALIVDPETSRRLGLVRQRNTSPEQLVRRLLHRLGFRFRVGGRGLPGSPDIANRTRRWAVFVHGCFWHAHSRCPKATVPKRNRVFWTEKLAANRERDRRVVRKLRAAGYTAMVVWECELKSSPAAVERRLLRVLGYARGKRAS